MSTTYSISGDMSTEDIDNKITAVDTSAALLHPTPAVTLPQGYLVGGYHATTANGQEYLRPEYVGDYAEHLAKALSPMRLSEIRSLLREMKRSKKGTLPYEARLTAAYEMLPKALDLVRRKRAPELLVVLIRANLEAISEDKHWTAYYRHLEAISGYLTLQEGG